MTVALQQSSLFCWRGDAVRAAAVGGVFFLLYAVLMQANLNYDGATFLDQAAARPIAIIPYHPLYLHVLAGIVRGGAAFGLSGPVAGSLFSAACMAVAVALFFGLLRRAAVGAALAAVYAALFGLSGAALENGTVVEHYGLAMVCVLLALHAFWPESDAPSPRRLLGIWLACGMLVLVHVGFSFFVLALYLGLCLRGRRHPGRVVALLAQGASILLVLGLTLRLLDQSAETVHQSYTGMFEQFFMRMSWRDALRQVLLAPMTGFHFHAGLMLFPAVAGGWIMRRDWPGFAVTTVLATLLFIGFYSFWPVLNGSFYMPLMVLWGVFAARAAQEVFSRGGPGRMVLFFGLLALDAGVYCFALRTQPFWNDPLAMSPLWILGFYALLAAQSLLIVGLNPSAPGPVRRSRWIGSLACVVLLTQAVHSLPRIVALQRPDTLREAVAALQRLEPGVDPDRLRLVSRFQRERVRQETGIAAEGLKAIATSAADGPQYDAYPLLQWVRATADPVRPLHVWFDGEAMAEARAHWPVGIVGDIPFDQLVFTRRESGAEVFYRVEFKDPRSGRIHAQWHDPYPAENWGGVPVCWLRPLTEWPLPARAGTLRVHYVVGHPGVSAERPVRVRIEQGGRTLWDRTHPVSEPAHARLPMDLTGQTSPTLTIRTDPGWQSPEGRHLGVALYPLEWEAPAGQP